MGRAVTCLVAVAILAATGCGGDEETTTVSAPTGTHMPASPGSSPTAAPTPVANDPPAPPSPVVIASGFTPSGEPFELVAHGLTKHQRLCLSFMFPRRALPDGSGACGDQLFVRFHGPIAAWGSARGKDTLVDGWVSPDVERVEITYDHGGPQAIEAVTEQIPARILRAGGADKPRGIFVAFLPRDVDASDVIATAYDVGGEELGSVTWPDLEEAR